MILTFEIYPLNGLLALPLSSLPIFNVEVDECIVLEYAVPASTAPLTDV